MKQAATHPATRRRPCPAQILADAAGLTIDEVCRRAGHRKEGMSRSYFLRLCRDGGANYSVARKLARILGCEVLVLVWGYPRYLRNAAPRASAEPETGRVVSFDAISTGIHEREHSAPVR